MESTIISKASTLSNLRSTHFASSDSTSPLPFWATQSYNTTRPRTAGSGRTFRGGTKSDQSSTYSTHTLKRTALHKRPKSSQYSRLDETLGNTQGLTRPLTGRAEGLHLQALPNQAMLLANPELGLKSYTPDSFNASLTYRSGGGSLSKLKNSKTSGTLTGKTSDYRVPKKERRTSEV